MDQHDDMETPTEVGKDRMRGGTDGEQHHDMYVGIKFKFEGLDLVSPFRIGGFLGLNFLLDHHLWIIHMNSE